VLERLIALGFVGQASRFGSSFEAFAMVVLPTLFALGAFTFVRLVHSSLEDLFYGRAINRIRGYYRQLVGEQARYLMLGGHDDVNGVLHNGDLTVSDAAARPPVPVVPDSPATH
jgi:hypothetical protein